MNFFAELGDVGFWQNTCFVRLPFSVVQFIVLPAMFREDLWPISAENLEIVVYFESFKKDRGQEITTASWPIVSGCARRLGGTNLLETIQLPEVHFSAGNVTKSTEQNGLTERTNLDDVSESFSKFKGWFSISVIQSGHSWLLSWDNDELLTCFGPFHILNLVLEDCDQMSIFTFVDSDVYKRVLSVVTFSWRIV